MGTHDEQFERAVLEMQLFEEVKKNPSFAIDAVSIVVSALEDYRKRLTKKNSQIDLIVRNLKPEYYSELQKFVVPEVFENLGLQDAIKVIEKSE